MKIQDLENSTLDAGNRTVSSNEKVLDLKTALFWFITQRIVIISYQRLTLKMGPIFCSETYISNYFTEEACIGLDLCGYSYVTAEGNTSFLLSTWKSECSCARLKCISL